MAFKVTCDEQGAIGQLINKLQHMTPKYQKQYLFHPCKSWTISTVGLVATFGTARTTKYSQIVNQLCPFCPAGKHGRTFSSSSSRRASRLFFQTLLTYKHVPSKHILLRTTRRIMLSRLARQSASFTSLAGIQTGRKERLATLRAQCFPGR